MRGTSPSRRFYWVYRNKRAGRSATWGITVVLVRYARAARRAAQTGAATGVASWRAKCTTLAPRTLREPTMNSSALGHRLFELGKKTISQWSDDDAATHAASLA